MIAGFRRILEAGPAPPDVAESGDQLPGSNTATYIDCVLRTAPVKSVRNSAANTITLSQRGANRAATHSGASGAAA